MSEDSSAPVAPKGSGPAQSGPTDKGLRAIHVEGVGVLMVFSDEINEKGQRELTGFRPNGAIGRVTLDTDESRRAEQAATKSILMPKDPVNYIFDPSFFVAFSCQTVLSPLSAQAMLALLISTMDERARLPLFERAQQGYTALVTHAIFTKIREVGDSPELLKTKSIIVRLALRFEYREKVFMPGVCLSHLDLSGLNLSGLNLSGAKCFRTKFTGANLSGTILRNADLRAASLRGANMAGADLQNSRLTGANLVGVDLNRLRNGESTNFSGATTDRWAEFRDSCVIS